MLSHPIWTWIFDFSGAATTLAANVFVQSLLVLIVGLTAVGAMRRRGAPVRSCVLRVTLLAVLFCPLATLLLEQAGVSGFRIALVSSAPTVTLPPQAIAGPAEMETGRAVAPDASPAAESWTLPSFAEVPHAVDPLSAMEGTFRVVQSEPIDDHAPVLASSALTPLKPPPNRFAVIYTVFTGAWLMASLFLTARLLLANLLMRHARRTADAAPRNVAEDCRAIAAKMGITAPPVLISAWVNSPCLIGWLRPAVLVPANLKTVSPDVLVHELAHLRRHDCLWNFLSRACVAALPWQPLLWLLSRRLGQVADEVCDDCVVAHSLDRASYARELVDLAERFQPDWSTATAAVGIAEFPSCLGRRVLRILDTSRALSTRTGMVTLSIILALGTGGTLLVGLLGADSSPKTTLTADKLATNQDAKKPTTVPEKFVQVSGVVLKPDGTPATGATVRAASNTNDFDDLQTLLGEDYKTPMSVASTDNQGRFTISIHTQPFGDISNLDLLWREIWKNTAIAASVDSFGPAWVVFKEIDPDKPITLRLVEDMPIKGRVIDLEGRPIAGTVVQIGGPRAAEGEDLSKWITSMKAGEAPQTAYKHASRSVDARLIGTPENVTTGDDGSFEIHGIGRERIISLEFGGETVAHRGIKVVTRKTKPFQKATSSFNRPTETVFGAEFTYSTPPARTIEGIVIDAKTREPLARVAVQSYKLGNYPFFGQSVIKTTTNEEGRFRLVGMPKAEGNILMMVPNDDQPYFMRKVDVPNPAGIEPVSMTIELHHGIWITGRVTDKVTDEPVPGVRLLYLPFLTNKYAQALPEFHDNGNTDSDQRRYRTNANGEYRLVGCPAGRSSGLGATSSRIETESGTKQSMHQKKENRIGC